jgi:hypothetical protein
MAHMGKSHLIIMFTVGPDDVASGRRASPAPSRGRRGRPRSRYRSCRLIRSARPLTRGTGHRSGVARASPQHKRPQYSRSEHLMRTAVALSPLALFGTR